jgi:hypothetical protein
LNPGIYPPGLAANATAGNQARLEAEHKELVAQFERFKGFDQALKDIILEAVNKNYMLEIEDKLLGFLNQTPKQMIAHLCARGRQLDFTDTKKLISERDAEWDVSKVPQVYFNRVKKAVKQLENTGITSNMNERRDMALYYLKASGEYNAAVREWEAKPITDKTWPNIKVFISNEYAKEKNRINSPQNNSKQTKWKSKWKQLKN